MISVAVSSIQDGLGPLGWFRPYDGRVLVAPVEMLSGFLVFHQPPYWPQMIGQFASHTEQNVEPATEKQQTLFAVIADSPILAFAARASGFGNKHRVRSQGPSTSR
jgi:hypothetical protein